MVLLDARLFYYYYYYLIVLRNFTLFLSSDRARVPIMHTAYAIYRAPTHMRAREHTTHTHTHRRDHHQRKNILFFVAQKSAVSCQLVSSENTTRFRIVFYSEWCGWS